MNAPTDYHNYVFRGGKLVGEFEEMYRNSAIVPWHQDEQASWIDVRLTKEMMRDVGKFDEIHDLGCGTGHYLNLIAEDSLASGGMTYGYDISETACKTAARNFPNSKFSVFDLTEQTTKTLPPTKVGEPQPTRLFMIRATLWYVHQRFETVIDNIKSMMISGDRLLVVQNFPPLDSQFIGKEVLPNHSALIRHFSRSFVLDRHIWYEDRFALVNDNWFIGVFSVRD